MTNKKIIDVAAAVIEREDGAYLLGQRAPDTFYPGYWEFPGGKIEAGESAHAALVRELHEELEIEVLRADPWLRREHRYEHGHVRLQFFRVRAWRGECKDHVHSALTWQRPAAPYVAPMLPANASVLKALELPPFYAITHAAELGATHQLAALDEALRRGLKLLQLREPDLTPTARADFYARAVELCRRADARVLVNRDAELARRVGADGVHLSSAQLAVCTQRPDFPLVAASCHSPAELEHAARLGCDFTVYGPVETSATHPERNGIGWDAFAAQLSVPPAPTFALGGLSAQDIDIARRCGAHGVAAIRSAWSDRAERR